MKNKTIEDIFREFLINPLKKDLIKNNRMNQDVNRYLSTRPKIGDKLTINYPKAKEYDPDEEEKRKVRLEMKKAKKELKELNEIMTTTTNKKKNRL